MIYYRDYIADYLRDTVDLTLIEHGAYGMMMRYYYADENPLPLDVNLIYRRLRAMAKAEQQVKKQRVSDLAEAQGKSKRPKPKPSKQRNPNSPAKTPTKAELAALEAALE